MDTQSLSNIRERKEALDELLRTYKVEARNAGHNLSEVIGYESEYTVGSLIQNVNDAMYDISYLLRASKIFIQLSTYTERQHIADYLTRVHNHLSGYQFQEAIGALEELKPILRGYNLRYNKERQISFEEAIDTLIRKADQIDGSIQQINNLNKQAESLHNDLSEKKGLFDKSLEEIQAEKENLVTNLATLQEQYGNLNESITEGEEYGNQILEILNVAKANETTIKTFAENVVNRESQLNDQQIKSKQYTDKLTEYTNERDEILIEARRLIAEAREALRLKTSQGISAAFSGQYDIANKPIKKIGWLIGATKFLLLTISLGIWVIGGWFIENPNEVRSIIGRVALLPLSLLGTLFCANQYVKQKNLAEDYAYKSVLAKSIVAFTDELKEKNGDKQSEYLTTVLAEIHKDPLRKRGKEERNITENLGVFQKILELAKEISAS